MPGAPLSGSSRRPPQRAGSRFACVQASSFPPRHTRSSLTDSAPPPTAGLRRAPHATRRLCRVSSCGGGDARNHVSRPRSGGRRESGRREEVHRRAGRPCRGASPSGPTSPGSPQLALQASPSSSAYVSPSRRSPPARPASLSPAATYLRPGWPSACPKPCTPAVGGRRVRPAHLRRRRRPPR